MGVVAAPAKFSPRMTMTAPQQESRPDRRLGALRHFLEKAKCPVAQYASDFLAAADRFSLDWRLLPSLSFVESDCGRAASHNNLFGWDSGRAHFDSPRHAIQAVASHLAKYPIYRSKTVDGILRIYNPRGEYAKKVKSVMQQIAAVE